MTFTCSHFLATSSDKKRCHLCLQLKSEHALYFVQKRDGQVLNKHLKWTPVLYFAMMHTQEEAKALADEYSGYVREKKE